MQDKKVEEKLKQQVLEIMKDENNPQIKKEKNKKYDKKRKGKKKKHRVLKVIGIILLSMLLMVVLAIGTKPGRSIIYKLASKFVYSNIQKPTPEGEDDKVIINKREPSKDVVHEDYVVNYLIFGIEKLGGARNTDAMLIGSLNTKDGKIKLTSLLRDSYVEIPGYKANKLNSAYAKGGVELLIETIEKNYKIHINGYASVDFEAFEGLVDLLGGVTIELGKEEADYLNRTNYISVKANRNVVAGKNKLNGNQVMGYVRVRKAKTLGGANYDYGRVVRQQRALGAMFDSLMSSKNMFKLLSISKEVLGYVTTDLNQQQIEKMIESVVENKIITLDTLRIPVDGEYEAPKKYNGIGYPIILDWESNLIELHKFIYGYSNEEAKEALAAIE